MLSCAASGARSGLGMHACRALPQWAVPWRAAVQMTGQPLHAKKVYGKPNKEPYTLVEDVLLTQVQ